MSAMPEMVYPKRIPDAVPAGSFLVHNLRAVNPYQKQGVRGFGSGCRQPTRTSILVHAVGRRSWRTTPRFFAVLSCGEMSDQDERPARPMRKAEIIHLDRDEIDVLLPVRFSMKDRPGPPSRDAWFIWLGDRLTAQYSVKVDFKQISGLLQEAIERAGKGSVNKP
jgi:hypothetical protein